MVCFVIPRILTRSILPHCILVLFAFTFTHNIFYLPYSGVKYNAQPSIMVSIVAHKAVRVEGAQGPNSSRINGLYIPTSQMTGRITSFKRFSVPDPGNSSSAVLEDIDIDISWLEYFSPKKKWHIKSAASRGVNKCYAHIKGT